MSNIFHSIGEFGSKHSVGLWMGASGGFFAASLFFAFKDSPKMHRCIRRTKRQVRYCKDEAEAKQYKREGMKELIKLAIPTALCAAGAVASAAASLHASGKKIAGLSLAYGATRELLRDYQAEVREELGESKEQKIRERVHEKRINNQEFDAIDISRLAGPDEFVIYDEVTNFTFTAKGSTVISALQRITGRLQHGQDDWIPINEFYYDVCGKTVKNGDNVGWSEEDVPVEPYYLPKFDNDEQKLYAAIQYTVTPKNYEEYKYSRR